MLIKHTVDKAIDEYHKAVDEPIAAPEIIHHPVDPVLQTGESRKLGGAMEIKSNFSRE
jgi:hypothetical protein